MRLTPETVILPGTVALPHTQAIGTTGASATTAGRSVSVLPRRERFARLPKVR